MYGLYDNDETTELLDTQEELLPGIEDELLLDSEDELEDGWGSSQSEAQAGG